MDVRCDAGAGGGFPALPRAVAGGVEQVLIEGGGGAPVPGPGALAGGGGRGALEAGAAGGAFVPPGVVQAGDGGAQLRADGAGLAADELADGDRVDAGRAGDAGRAVAHDVQGAQPQPGPGRVQPCVRQGRADHREDGGGRAGLCSPVAGGQGMDGVRGQHGRGGDRPVGPAALPQLGHVLAGRLALAAAGRLSLRLGVLSGFNAAGATPGGGHCPASGSGPACGA